MTSPSETEKQRLEHEAARLFMRWYERETGQRIRHIWHNRPSKPDASCFLNGQRLDLEIAHLYGTEQEAMQILGRELPAPTQHALQVLDRETDAHSRLLKALNRILRNKAGKHYASERVWLVIRNAHPAWTRDEVLTLRHHIKVPSRHPFEQIWMVGDMNGQTGIVQLYP